MIAVDLNKWSVRFGDYFALENISIKVPAGSFTAIMGPNGSGKSTLLKSLLGLVRPIGGEIRLFGNPPGMIPFDVIGYVPQVKALDRSFPATALELVLSGRGDRWPISAGKEKRQACEALERVGALQLKDRAVQRLSGGELQRVYLARSLIKKPQLVLLDEPAAGVDIAGEADMYRLLEEYQMDSGSTILLVTHDFEVARYHSSHVLLLNCRRISFGSPAEAMTDECMRRVFGHVGHEHKMHGSRG